MRINKARWRGPARFGVTKRLRAVAYCFTLLIVFFVCSISIFLLELDSQITSDVIVTDYDFERNFAESNACPIPRLDPFERSFQHLLDKTPPEMDCETSYPLLFNSTLRSTIVPVEYDYLDFRKNQYESCCYRTVERDTRYGDPDKCERISPTCFDLSLSNETQIPDEHEFIIIYCRRKSVEIELSLQKDEDDVTVDAHAFVHLKPRKVRVRRRRSNGTLNVVIFGMDSVSRMNFMRTMPKSYSYLKKELDGVKMFGYNKMEDDKFANLMPMLTSQKPSDRNFCILRGREHRSNPYKNCPFIWNKYAAKGYYTSFAEDAPGRAIFNYRNPGFMEQPTDYYLRPLSHWANNNIGSFPQLNRLNGCYGPRLTFQYILDYTEKLMYTMKENKRNFFHFSWATALTHDYQSAGILGDPHLLRSLKWMKQSGYLNDTVLILMSDHGHLGSQRFGNTTQGQLEDRLPLLFLVFPDSFKKNYKDAYENLLRNRDRLVTTFDLYETLNDILNPGAIEIEASSFREKLASFFGRKTKDLPRGISLFQSIPKSRTCQMAGIKREFCLCNVT